jgi:hypothetical protein
MAYDSHMKADHNGAKNGGGYFGTRQEAKENAKVARRHQAKDEIELGLVDCGEGEIVELDPELAGLFEIGGSLCMKL